MISIVSAGVQQDTYDDAIRIYHLNGNAIDSKNGLNNGSVSGAVNTSGILGDAYEFDGVNDKIDLGAIGTNYPASWNLWVKTNEFDVKRRALGRYYTQTSLGLFDNDAGQWVYVLFSDGGTINTGYAYDSNIDKWIMMTMTYNGTDIVYYFNGTQIESDTATGDIDNLASDWQIGTHGNDGHWWNGTIDEVTFYDSALTQDQIDWLWNSGAGNELEPEPMSILGTIYPLPSGVPYVKLNSSLVFE